MKNRMQPGPPAGTELVAHRAAEEHNRIGRNRAQRRFDGSPAAALERVGSGLFHQFVPARTRGRASVQVCNGIGVGHSTLNGCLGDVANGVTQAPCGVEVPLHDVIDAEPSLSQPISQQVRAGEAVGRPAAHRINGVHQVDRHGLTDQRKPTSIRRHRSNDNACLTQ